MTDKATVEIPSLYAGTIVSLGGEIGQTLAVGAVLVTIDQAGEGGAEAPRIRHPRTLSSTRAAAPSAALIELGSP